jgi:hypothetical protein
MPPDTPNTRERRTIFARPRVKASLKRIRLNLPINHKGVKASFIKIRPTLFSFNHSTILALKFKEDFSLCHTIEVRKCSSVLIIVRTATRFVWKPSRIVWKWAANTPALTTLNYYRTAFKSVRRARILWCG